jgi:hypothetical protein
MKIYTFNAASDTPVELLWPFRPDSRNKAFERLIAENRWTEVPSIKECDIAIYPKKAFNPESLAFDRSVLTAVEEAEACGKPLVIDATCDSDQPLDIATASILRFGLYKSKKQPFETERPYWINWKDKQDLESLEIRPRAQKPAVGFCGTTYAAGKYFKLGRALPLQIAQAALSKGSISRLVDIRIKKGMSHTVRQTAIDWLAADPRIESCFDVTNNLQDYYNPANPNRKDLEDRFVRNMNQSDYALCVRANGNYSGRFYMALNAGRIPLLIDTDVFIPFEEKLHMVKIPVKSLHKIGDLLLEHFDKFTEREFETMKRENREAYNKFLAPDKFVPNFLETVRQSAKS